MDEKNFPRVILAPLESPSERFFSELKNKRIKKENIKLRPNLGNTFKNSSTNLDLTLNELV